MAHKLLNTLECYVKDGDKYLMLHRAADKTILPGVWMAPGGKREFNEGLFDCARREIKEETGLEIKNLKIISHGNGYMSDVETELHFHFLMADLAGGVQHERSPDGELRWVTLEEMLSLDNILAELPYVLPLVLTTGAGPVLSYSVVYSSGNRLESIKIEQP